MEQDSLSAAAPIQRENETLIDTTSGQLVHTNFLAKPVINRKKVNASAKKMEFFDSDEDQ